MGGGKEQEIITSAANESSFFIPHDEFQDIDAPAPPPVPTQKQKQ